MTRKDRWIAWVIFAIVLSAPMVVQAIWSNVVLSLGVEAFILIVVLVVLMVPDGENDN